MGRRSRTKDECTNAYVHRLRDILRFGMWMTTESEQDHQAAYKHLDVPRTPRCCFTELKLSESRQHARVYGRLGIGVKRRFLFDRFGRPLAYYGFNSDRQWDPFLEACLNDLKDRRLLNFFKPMNRDLSNLNYDLYSESEWRILFFKKLLELRYIIDPRDANNEEHHEYFLSLPESTRERLDYLVPLDGWFSMIIYPSGDARNAAQRDGGIANEIRRIKSQTVDLGGRIDYGNRVEKGSWPIELGLDNCRDL